MTDPGLRDRWNTLSARERGAIIRAVRRGDRVAEEDRPLAVEVARREVQRLTANVRPGRVLVWRVVQGLAAVFLLLVAIASFAAGDVARAGLYLAAALLFGSSALFAQKRLDDQVGRLARALEVNGPGQDDDPRV